MKHALVFQVVASAAVVLLSVGCSEVSPVQPEPVNNIRQPVYAITPATSYAASDDETAFEVDAATGRLKVTDLSTNAVVYADLDASQVADIGNVLTALGDGDGNYNALETLNPYQNMPPGYEPEFGTNPTGLQQGSIPTVSGKLY